jgi:hypothetical protein
MTNVPEGPFFYVLFVVIPALFIAFVAWELARVLEQERIPGRRLAFACILTIISLACVAFVHMERFPENILFGFVAFLWFPLAVVIALLCFKNPPCRTNQPALVSVITFIIYNLSMALFMLGQRAGLRDGSVLFYPPVPMTYELMLWPVGIHAVIQFFLILVLACILISAISHIPGLGDGAE